LTHLYISNIEPSHSSGRELFIYLLFIYVLFFFFQGQEETGLGF